MTTNISLGEFEGLVVKAFRGAGYPWGLASDAAYACRRLESAGFSSAGLAVRLLDQIDGRSVAEVMPDATWEATSGMLCPICVGAAVADVGDALFADTEQRSFEQVVEPMLFVALLSLSPSVREGQSLMVQWSGGHTEVTTRGLLHNGAVPAGTMTVGVTRIADTATPMSLPHTRARLTEEHRESLLAYAARTYAPATDQSRQGAGAGLTDNN